MNSFYEDFTPIIDQALNEAIKTMIHSGTYAPEHIFRDILQEHTNTDKNIQQLCQKYTPEQVTNLLITWGLGMEYTNDKQHPLTIPTYMQLCISNHCTPENPAADFKARRIYNYDLSEHQHHRLQTAMEIARGNAPYVNDIVQRANEVIQMGFQIMKNQDSAIICDPEYIEKTELLKKRCRHLPENINIDSVQKAFNAPRCHETVEQAIEEFLEKHKELKPSTVDERIQFKTKVFADWLNTISQEITRGRERHISRTEKGAELEI